MLEKLEPQLAELDPGKTIVSLEFDLPKSEPNTVLEFDAEEDGPPRRRKILVWKTPLTKKP